MLKGSLVLIFRNLTQRRLRSALTTLGVIIGIAAIVGMVSATQGISTSITGQLEKLQGNRITVTPGGGAEFLVAPPRRRALYLKRMSTRFWA